MIPEQGQSVIVKNKVYKVVELFKDCFLAQRKTILNKYFIIQK